MSAIGTLIENVMSAGVMNTVPITITGLRVAEKQEGVTKKFVLAVELQNGAGKFFEIGRTGDISVESDRVDVGKTVQVPYQFTEIQKVKFIAYEATEDENAETKEVGCTTVTLGQILSKRDIAAELSNGIGALEIKTEKIADSRSIILDVCAEKLEKKDLFGKSDPFLQISRKEDNGTWTVIHKTEHIKDTLNPHWKGFTLSYHLLCGDDPERDVKFACYDFDRSGNYDFLGEAFFAPSLILKNNSTQSFALTNEKKKLKKKGLGRLLIKKCKVKKEPSFISYILAGCRLHLTCGIDFTGSNGDPQQNSSLHYMGSANPNKYVLSLRAVGQILQEYTCDKQIKAYGFGAKIPPDFQVSHDFVLGDREDPVCAGMDEVLKAYSKSLDAVKLWGPTNFAPIINKIADEAVAGNGRTLNYHILLILTDGVVTDADDTKKAIVRASKLPISIIIVGIGNADFGQMDVFNKGKSIKSADGETAARQIVKCVSFRSFNFSSMDALARNLLEDIPFQITEYFTLNEIDPPTEEEKEDTGKKKRKAPATPTDGTQQSNQVEKVTEEPPKIANGTAPHEQESQTSAVESETYVAESGQTAEKQEGAKTGEQVSVF